MPLTVLFSTSKTVQGDAVKTLGGKELIPRSPPPMGRQRVQKGRI